MTKTEKYTLKIAIIYTLIMALGMSTSNFLFRYHYGSPQILNVIIYFEVIMSILAIVGWKKLKKMRVEANESIPTISGKIKFDFWFLPIAIFNVVQIVFVIFKGNFHGQMSMVIVSLLATALVGFSEELVYRGIVFNGFLEKRGTVKAVLISSTAFSLLHAANILGGAAPMAVFSQLCLTFIIGIIFSCLYLRMNNLVAIMILHWTWDFSLMLIQLTKINFAKFGIAFIILQIITLIAMILWMKNKNNNTSKKIL